MAEDEMPSDALMNHPDSMVKTNVAAAVGLERLTALSNAREAEGQLVRAAQASWISSLLDTITPTVRNDMVFKTSDLLERADDETAAVFEKEVLRVALLSEVSSQVLVLYTAAATCSLYAFLMSCTRLSVWKRSPHACCGPHELVYRRDPCIETRAVLSKFWAGA